MRLRTLVLVAVLAVAACVPLSIRAASAPTISSLDRTSGPPHTIVMVQGTDLDDSSIVWDAGTANATVIPGGYLSASMFSVPPGARTGVHNVAVRNSSGESTSVPFTVVGSTVAFPKPRIDSVTLFGTTFDDDGYVTAGLYVQGANIDVGAVVLIGGVEAATVTHQALRSEWPDVPASNFSYPITHFVSTAALSGIRTPGETIVITVRNLDTQMSDAFSYKLPASADTVDSDGDGLIDSWETDGYSGIDLKAKGADPYHRDIFVELDVMPAGTATQAGLRYPPSAATLDAVKAMFSAAPFLNPTSPPGINLILDTSGSVPYTEEICFDLGTSNDCDDLIPLGVVKYSALKALHFDNPNRDKIFHYGIWGAKISGGDPGKSDFYRNDGGDDFIIAFDEWGSTSSHPEFVQVDRTQVDELAHELGHDLGLHHGGGYQDDYPYRPNHWSAMAYSWDKRAGFDDQFRLDHATCPPFYYGGGTESSTGEKPQTIRATTDYSSGIAKSLSPSAAAVAICGKTVKWDKDGIDETVPDVADWPMLRFDGPAKNGWLVP
jgi:hypothetical protein